MSEAAQQKIGCKEKTLDGKGFDSGKKVEVI
jgi:hypothetical protein